MIPQYGQGIYEQICRTKRALSALTVTAEACCERRRKALPGRKWIREFTKTQAECRRPPDGEGDMDVEWTSFSEHLKHVKFSENMYISQSERVTALRPQLPSTDTKTVYTLIRTLICPLPFTIMHIFIDTCSGARCLIVNHCLPRPIGVVPVYHPTS